MFMISVAIIKRRPLLGAAPLHVVYNLANGCLNASVNVSVNVVWHNNVVMLERVASFRMQAVELCGLRDEWKMLEDASAVARVALRERPVQ
jgi:hypothetical protein